MKTILVDAINAFVSEEGEIDKEMHKMLEGYPNRKIILTGANDEQIERFGLDNMPYEVFTLKHDPEKTDSKYYEMMLDHFNLEVEDVIYFEHGKEAVESARSVGIETYYYDHEERDIEDLKEFINKGLGE